MGPIHTSYATIGACLILLLLSQAHSARAWTVNTSRPSTSPRFSKFCDGHQLPTALLAASSTADISSELASILDDIGDDNSFPLLRIGNRVGSGSYGTVHQGYFIQSKDDIQPCIAKRAWTFAELEAGVPSQILKLGQRDKQQTGLAIAQRTGLASAKLAENDVEEISYNNESESLSPSELKTRAERCRHFWEVERHCFQKIEENNKQNGASNSNNAGRATPEFLGVHNEEGTTPQTESSETVQGYGLLGKEVNGGAEANKGHPWMVFDFVTGVDGEPAQTLLDAMEMDWKDQHQSGGKDNHHLYDIQRAMNFPETHTLGSTLDAVFLALLESLTEIHDCNIVHRDLKPGNLLCDGSNQRLRLIDFGSAADLDPSPKKGNAFESLLGGTQRVGYDAFVAISPIYSAPETFVKLNENPLAFDVFSAGLIMSQLLFNLLDERTDAGFLQRLKEVNYDLDLWIEKELGAKLRPAGLESGLEYLGERRGMFALLKNMFEPDPTKRISSTKALELLKKIIGLRNGDFEWSDKLISDVAREEAFFETVIESFESCKLNLAPENMPRPLHFLASFKKGKPVGLLLAEASEVENDGSMSSEVWDQWQRATQHALPGEVFVKGWDVGSQADQIGIFEIGDRLRGVGELPFNDGGFEKAVDLIDRQPKMGDIFKLHFDRISAPNPPKSEKRVDDSQRAKVSQQGAWKSGGRRGAQEDAFVLHEIKNEQMGDVLLAGVFDGHAGTAASETASSILPPLFTQALQSVSIREALERSWDITCDTYRNGCDENGECVADYDPIQGILYAETGSTDVFAGCTATIAAIAMNPSGTNELTILNCGDSRTLVVGEPTSPDDSGNSFVTFETRDHSPDDELEIERLVQGRAAGLDYSIPQCYDFTTSGSFMRIDQFQYALCRSLEGSYVTSKGIVSDADVTTLNLSSSLADRRDCALVLACDGLFEVMSNEEVGREVVRLRQEGYKAGDVAKNLCGQALKKGSYDNLSVLVVYLDDA